MSELYLPQIRYGANEAVKSIGSAMMGRQAAQKDRQLRDLVGKAYTGDQAAMGKLMAVNPTYGIAIQEKLMKRKQDQLSMQVTQKKLDAGPTQTADMKDYKFFQDILNDPKSSDQDKAIAKEKLGLTGDLSKSFVEGFDAEGKFGRFPSNDPKLIRAATTGEKKVIAMIGADKLNTKEGKELLEYFNSGGSTELEVDADGNIKFKTGVGSRTIGAETKAQISDIAMDEAKGLLMEVGGMYNELADKGDAFGVAGQLTESYGAPVSGVSKQSGFVPGIAASAATGFMVDEAEIPKVAAFRQAVRKLSEKTKELRSAYGNTDRATNLILNRADAYFGLGLDGDQAMFMKGMESMEEAAKSRTKFLEAQSGEVKAPQTALDYLKQHPESMDAFEKKYGYRPDQSI